MADKCFTMGTHGDFDKEALSVCRDLRRKYKDIKIEVVITSFAQIKLSLIMTKSLEMKSISLMEMLKQLCMKLKKHISKRK